MKISINYIMENLDLDIQNYNLNDILKLFNLNYNFTIDDLKKSKRIVLKTHPDKSGLDKKYFLFFSKAYKMIYHIHDFRNKEKQSDKYSEHKYFTDDMNEEEHKYIIKNMNNKEDFHNWFNRLFEKYYTRDDDGYGDWLKSNDDITKMTNFNEMTNNIDIIKKQQKERSIVKHVDFEQNANLSCGSSELYNTTNNYTSTNSFGSIQYNDLKQAFQETLVPVTNDDYNNKKKFSTIQELNIYRKQNETKPLSEEEVNIFMKQKEEQQQEISTQMAYNLIKQGEKNLEKQKDFWSTLKLIGNSK